MDASTSGAGRELGARTTLAYASVSLVHPGLHAERPSAGGCHHPTRLCRCRRTPAGGTRSGL